MYSGQLMYSDVTHSARSLTGTAGTYANPDVLEFYKELPFNIEESVRSQAETLKSNNSVLAYPVFAELISRDRRILEIGCGAGWLSNSMAYHYGVGVSAIDFNPVAIERAAAVADFLDLDARFQVADLFAYEPEPKADLVASIGVLHHTDNCHAAIQKILTDYVAPGGYAFIGLYHTHGRRPFLDHFTRMREGGATEDDMFRRYCDLMPQATDPIHARSWFRDQVLHPHETQHTLAEILPLLDECHYELVSTSINRFEPIDDIGAVLDREEEYEQVSLEWLRQGKYFPGFFVFLVRNTASQ